MTFNQAACVRSSPSVKIVPQTQTGVPGQTLTYEFSLLNMNMLVCPSATYAVTPKAPAGWTVTPPTFIESLVSNQKIIRTFTVTSKLNARAGSYEISQKAVDVADRKLFGGDGADYVIP